MWTGELPGVVVKLGNLLQEKIRRCGLHKNVKEEPMLTVCGAFRHQAQRR
jgi:hypothetical protein